MEGRHGKNARLGLALHAKNGMSQEVRGRASHNPISLGISQVGNGAKARESQRM